MSWFGGNRKETARMSFIESMFSFFGSPTEGPTETHTDDAAAAESSDPLNTIVNPTKTAAELAEFGLKELYAGGADAEVDIVAVHGLDGHYKKSFTTDKGVCWLTSLLPEVVPNIRVFSYGYDERRTHTSSPLGSDHILGHAEAFLEALTKTRELTKTTKRPIIFVAHGFGGIVLKSVLLLSASRTASHQEAQRSIKLSTYGVLFLGVPHRDSDDFPWATLTLKLLSVAWYRSPEILAHVQENSEWLEKQQAMYLPISSDFDTAYFLESYPTVVGGAAVKIVPKYSAYLGSTDAGVMVTDSDHRNMARYGDQADVGFQAVSGTLRVMVSKAQGKINENWEMEEAVTGS